MNKKTFLLGIVVLSITMLVFIGCSNPAGNNDGRPVPGKLTITNLPSEIKLGAVIQVSPLNSFGWMSTVTGLFPENETSWRASLIGSNNGDQTNGSTYFSIYPGQPGANVFAYAPGKTFNYTGNSSVWFCLSDTATSESFTGYGVNNVQFTNGQAALDWAAFGFTLPETEGEFTLTGASSYDNKYAFALGVVDTNTVLYGIGNATSITAVKLFRIEGGEAKIPIYSITTGENKFKSYSGNDTVASFIVYIMETENWDLTTPNYSGMTAIVYMQAVSDQRVTFSSGKASKAVTDGSVVVMP